VLFAAASEVAAMKSFKTEPRFVFFCY